MFLDFFIPYISWGAMGATGTGVGVVIAMATAGHVISAPVAGYLADRVSKRRLVLVGACGRATAYFAMYAVIALRSLPGLMLAEFSLGFMVSFFWVPINAIIADKSCKECRSQAYAKRQFYKGTGLVIGTTLGIAIFVVSNVFAPGNPFLPHVSLFVFGTANVLAGISFYKHVDESLVHPSNATTTGSRQPSPASAGPVAASMPVPPGTPPKRGKAPATLAIGFVLVLVAVIFTSMNEALGKPFLRLLVLERVTPDPSIAILLFVPPSLVSLFLAPSIGKWADRVDPWTGIPLICTCGAVVTLLLVNTTVPWLFAVLLTVDSSLAMTTGLFVDNVLSRVSTVHRGKLFGLKSLAGNAGEMLAPVIGGILWDVVASEAPFLASVIIELGLAVLYLFVLRFISGHLAEAFARRELPAVQGKKKRSVP